MSRKNIGKIITCIVIISLAVAGCMLYFYKFRNSKKSLDEDFDDFEDDFELVEFDDSSESNEDPFAERSYVSIPFEPSEQTAEPDINAK